MQHHEPEYFAWKFVCYLQGQGHRKGSCDQKATLSAISSELLILWQPDWVWWCIILSQRLVEKLDYCIQGQGCSERSNCPCLPRWYLLNRQIFCCQIWYCNASFWVGVSDILIGLLFSRSRSQQGLIWSKYDSLHYIFWTADPFATKLCLMVHYHKPRVSYGEIVLLSSRSRAQQNFKMSRNVNCLSRWYLLKGWTFYYQT